MDTHSATATPDHDLPEDEDLATHPSLTEGDLPTVHRWAKVHGNAKLTHLTYQQHEWLRCWLEEENYPYQRVVELIQRHFGIDVGKSTVANYYRRHILSAHHDSEADSATALLERPIANISAATLAHARVLAWTLLTRPTPQIELAARLLEVIRRADQQEIARERLALEKERVALRREELAARPPRQPRHSPTAAGTRSQATPELPTPTSSLPADLQSSNPDLRSSPPLFPTFSSILQPPLHATPTADDEPASPSLASNPTPPALTPASVTSEPPPCSPCPPSPVATTPTPLQPVPTTLAEASAKADDSSFPPFSSGHSLPPSPTPTPPPKASPPGQRATACARPAPGTSPAWLTALAGRL